MTSQMVTPSQKLFNVLSPDPSEASLSVAAIALLLLLLSRFSRVRLCVTP